MELGRKWVAAAVAPVARIAQALLVSRQSLYKPRRERHVMARPKPRPLMPSLDVAVAINPEQLSVEDALVVLARRHVAYGYRRLWAKLRRAAMSSIASGCSDCCDCGATGSPGRVRIRKPRVAPSTSRRPTNCGRPT